MPRGASEVLKGPCRSYHNTAVPRGKSSVSWICSRTHNASHPAERQAAKHRQRDQAQAGKGGSINAQSPYLHNPGVVDDAAIIAEREERRVSLHLGASIWSECWSK